MTMIIGKNFKDKATVKLILGSVTKAATITKITPTQIICTLPLTKMGAGVYSLTVTNPDGITVTKLKAFTVIAAGNKPTITAISPKSAISSKNAVVTITGTNFRKDAIVQMILGSTVKKAAIKSLGSKKIVCTFPIKGVAAGKWNVKITNTDKTMIAKKGIFTVKAAKNTKQDESGSVSGIISNNPISMPSSTYPTRGNSLSGGVMFPANAPFVNQGVPVI